MNAFKINIESTTLKNKYYRKVLYTNKHQQLVIMNLMPFQEIGEEIHKNVSQFIKVEDGNGTAILQNNRYNLKTGDCIMINNNTFHNIKAGKNGLKLYTIYSPPEHKKKSKSRYKI